MSVGPAVWWDPDARGGLAGQSLEANEVEGQEGLGLGQG